MSDTPRPSPPLRCFPRLNGTARNHSWADDWALQFNRSSWQLTARAEESLSRLVPSLLCGEQSAQHVFHHQANALRDSSKLRLAAALRRIELEEEAHETALQALAAGIVSPADMHQRKRKSQHFYFALSRGVPLGQHFSRIAALDSCVCRIMSSLAGAQRETSAALYHLFTSIKNDEARHVGWCRIYARQLGVDRSEQSAQQLYVGGKIVEFLQSEADAFESLGVDADVLFPRLARGGRL